MEILVKRIRLIGRLALPYWRLGVMILVLMLCSTVVSLASPLMMKLFVDNVLINGNRVLLKWFAIIMILLFVLGSVLQTATSYSYNYLGQRLLLDIRNMLYEHIERMPPSFFAVHRSGEIIQRLFTDTSQIQSLVSTRIINIVMNVISAVGIIIVLLSLNPSLTVMLILVFPLFGITTVYFSKKIRNRERKTKEKSGELLSFFQETISFMSVVQSFVREKTEARRHLQKSRELIGLSLSGTLLSSSSGFVNGFLVSCATAFVYWYGGNAIFDGTLTLGGLLAYNNYVSKLFGPIAGLIGQNQGIQTALVSLERIFEFLDIKPSVRDSADAVHLKNPKGGIAFDQVSFSYTEKAPTLQEISFEVKPGESVALVGGSGSGKSTIGNLLLRFYDPDKGSIRLDGRDLRRIKLAALREHIGVVSQDVALFNATIMENIRYGRRDASDDEVIAAAYLAGIGSFIEEQLPDKFDTVVGEKGAKLSGGQKQRISIARVILKNPKILVLDEATSALDSESEKVVQTVLEYLMKGRTTVMIAHRFSTIKNVDRIIVLDRGKIIESGTHQELYDAEGIYRRLYDNQFREQTLAA